ncbi:WXG100 family type VII secretion target [Amycolatopsis suaedae]|uniref:WXG100 family type VII secretion target n=1 Tax=Amycolatopsis suaedae TaxID=2510978 RepID=A0A4Q7JCI5_9PSEU|nr:WXG100 family type VII secretion target [Amycolatopsis suaedae]RZQ65029.1 WXG100 family type VII secretion target [Amycolatopsis suaedae]
MTSGGGFTLRPDEAKSGGTQLSTAADALGQIGQTLSSALQAEGACWGDDESGKEFAKDYEPGAQGAVDAFTSLVEGLRGLKDQVDKAVAGFENTEETFTKDLSVKDA